MEIFKETERHFLNPDFSKNLLERNDFCNYVVSKYHYEFFGLAISLAKNQANSTLIAKDVIQEFYCKLLMNHSTIHKGYQQKGKNYLVRMIKSLFFDHLNNAMTSRQGIEPITELHEQVIEVKNSIDIDYLQNAINEHLSTIKKEHKAVFEMYLNGKKQTSIACILGIPANSVYTIVSRIKKAIQEKLKQSK